jgi:hypothetical protein
MSNYVKFKESIKHAAKHWAKAADQTFHENLTGKSKNHYPIWKHHRQGRPRNEPFEYCAKLRRKCLVRGVADGHFFCMSELPCWKETKNP